MGCMYNTEYYFMSNNDVLMSKCDAFFFFLHMVPVQRAPEYQAALPYDDVFDHIPTSISVQIRDVYKKTQILTHMLGC